MLQCLNNLTYSILQHHVRVTKMAHFVVMKQAKIVVSVRNVLPIVYHNNVSQVIFKHLDLKNACSNALIMLSHK